MDDEFSRDEIYGPSNVFFIKSGTVRCGCRLDERDNGADLKPKTKIGVISIKKKKKGSSPVSSTFCVIFKPKSVKMLFPTRRGPFFLFCFFFWRSPQFLSLLSQLHPCHDNQVCKRISPSRFGWRIN